MFTFDFYTAEPMCSSTSNHQRGLDDKKTTLDIKQQLG